MWTTKSAQLIASSLGKNPSTILRVIDETTVEGAKIGKKINTLFCTRSIIAG